MQSSQQAYYLQTLGIVQYVPKDAVLLADEAPAVAFNDRSIEDAGEAVVDRETIDVAARMNLNFDEPAVAKKGVPAAVTKKPAVSATSEPKVAAELIEVQFSLWQPNSEVLVCSGVEGVLADGDQMQLLTNILNAVGCGIHRLPQMDLVEWPPYPNADGDENEVREFLTTLLQARLKARPVNYILLLGDAAADWLLSSQQRGEQSGFGSLALTPETTALLLPSLSNMIDTPQLKASAWQVLKSVSFASATA